MKVDRIIIDGQLTAFKITAESNHVIILTKEEFLDLNKYITEYYAEVLQGLVALYGFIPWQHVQRSWTAFAGASLCPGNPQESGS